MLCFTLCKSDMMCFENAPQGHRRRPREARLLQDLNSMAVAPALKNFCSLRNKQT